MLTGYRLFYNDNPHTTIELVKKARVPSIVALNTQVHPELDGIVRKALARDRDERFQTAAEYMDALSQFLFSREMKVTSKNVAVAVKETREAKARASSTRQTLIQALVMDEINKMTSIIADEIAAKPVMENTGQTTALVDTTDWAKDLLDD
jgi:serine/threonine-protein kinase